jgi:glycosyltransferase involved in cell wall biosynthesis
VSVAETVISPLEGIDRYLRDTGLPNRPTLVVPNGVDLDGTAADNLPEELERAISTAKVNGRFIVLYAGALGVPNAMGQLFEAVKLLAPSTRERLALVVIGEGTQRQELERRGQALRPTLVTFAGPQPEPIVRLVATRCDAGFIGWLERPLYRYGTSPQKVPLMLAAGLPVIEAAPSCRTASLPADVGWSCPAERPAELAAILANIAATRRSRLTEMRIAATSLAQRLWGWDGIAQRAGLALGFPLKGSDGS